ncbi:MAG: hypothetical protein EPO24_00665, partial [Bacteroidetes bacterium]
MRSTGKPIITSSATKGHEKSRKNNGQKNIISVTSPSTAFTLRNEQLVAAYRKMFTARKCDDKILVLLRQGKAFFHIGGSGHEAAQVGTALALKPGHDWAYPYYRDMAFSLALGYSVEEVMLDALHRGSNPSSGGFAMPFHWGHKKWRIV